MHYMNGLKNIVLGGKESSRMGCKTELLYANQNCTQFRETVTTERSLRKHDTEYNVGSGLGSWRRKREKVKPKEV